MDVPTALPQPILFPRNEPTVDQWRTRPPPTRIILGYEGPIEMVDNRWTLLRGRTVELAIDATGTPVLSVPCSPPRVARRKFRIPIHGTQGSSRCYLDRRRSGITLNV